MDKEAVVEDLKTVSNPPSTKPAWLQRILDGIAFNKQRELAYDFSEVYVEKPAGKGYYRVDSYNVGQEIVSRKYTQFANITQETGQKYVDELAAKYPSGAKIADVPSNRRKGLSGVLNGNLILEVPEQTLPIPQSILDRAASKNITIRDINGRIY